jgi:riboflavin kinase/FMN adenylyltransferase
MRIFKGYEQITSIPNAVLTIGTFDGVHIGHQKILQQLNQEALKIGGESVLFTFYPHPRMVLFPDNHGLKLIQTQEEKLDKLKQYGLQNLIVQPFTSDFSNLTATEFVRDFLVKKLNVKKLVIGYDHQFGKNREGTLGFLKSMSKIYDFEVIEITAQEIDEVNISSTRIRKAIESGNIEIANTYLGERFELNGIVVKANQLGRTIGFPTANILIENDIKIIPKNGVYIVEVIIPNYGNLKGMMNIGIRPTIKDNLSLAIEVHILDFNETIYGSPIKVKLISRLRDEKKFNSIDELKKQLKDDEKISRAFFNTISI